MLARDPRPAPAKRKLDVDDPENPQADSNSAKIQKCNPHVLRKYNAPTCNSVSCSDKTPLSLLGMRFLNLLRESTNGELDLNQATQDLQTPKRRLYDITNVLSGINLIRKKTKNVIQWLGVLPGVQPCGLPCECRLALSDLIKEEWRLDELIATCTEELFQLSQQQHKYAYLTHEDVSKIDGFKDQTVMLIKAPAETKVEVSHPHEIFQVYVRSTLGPIDVFTCSDGSAPTENLYAAHSEND